MKKILLILSVAALLTACGTETKTAQQPENATDSVNETFLSTKSNTKNDRDIECDLYYTPMQFQSIEEFQSYAQSNQMTIDFPPMYDAQTGEQINYDDFSPLIPSFNENKYELINVELTQSCYVYNFKNKENENHISLSVSYDTYYHTFEEMVESYNANLVVDIENIETTIWNEIPALVQTVAFSEPVKYSIAAMIDENNSVYMSDDDMTPEELAACLSEFTFE